MDKHDSIIEAPECATFSATDATDNVAIERHPLTNQPHQAGRITDAQRAALREVAACIEGERGWHFWGPYLKDGAPKPPAVWRKGWVYPTESGWDDATTTRGLDDALALLGSAEGIAAGLMGVGLLVKTLAPDVVVLDFDKVLDAGGAPTALGSQVLRRFAGTYVEVSPSGTGLRVVCKGAIDWLSLAPVKLDGGSVEVYRPQSISIKSAAEGAEPGGKFVRMTGATLGMCEGSVEDAQRGLDWLDGRLMTACKGERRGADWLATGVADWFADDADDDGDAAPTPATGPQRGVWAALRRLPRWKERNAADVLRSLKGTAQQQPDSKIGRVIDGELGDWTDRQSELDHFVCCEAVRRGAGDLATVAEVWKATPAWRPEKPGRRKDYVQSTALGAVGDVVKGWSDRSRGASAQQVQAAAEAAEALKEIGEEPTLTRSGTLGSTVPNALLMLQTRDEWAGAFAFNEHTRKIERTRGLAAFERRGCNEAGTLTDDDAIRVMAGLERRCGVRLHLKQVQQAIYAAAWESRFNPVREKLIELAGQWDGVERLRDWLQVYMAATPEHDGTDLRPYLAKVGTAMMVAAVRRVLEPGCKFDTVLTLVGAGGGGKSTGFKVLAEALMPGLHTDSVHDLGDRKTLCESTQGKLIVELAELAAIRSKSELSELKIAITAVNDTRRKPYAPEPEDVARSFVFVATVNGMQFLPTADEAMRRRFWPVPVTSSEDSPIDFAKLQTDAPQLWAEATVMARRGESIYIEPSDAVCVAAWRALRAETVDPGPYAEGVYLLGAAWARGQPDNGDATSGGKAVPAQWCSLKEIAMFVGDEDAQQARHGADKRLARELSDAGFEKRKRNTGYRWHLPTSSMARYRQ